MSNFIEELYFGSINPQEYISNSNDATDEYLDVISDWKMKSQKHWLILIRYTSF